MLSKKSEIGICLVNKTSELIITATVNCLLFYEIITWELSLETSVKNSKLRVLN